MLTISLIVAILILISTLSESVIQYDYNHVNFVELDSTQALMDRFFGYEGMERSNTNIVLGVAREECKELLESATFRGVQRHAPSGQ